MIDVDLAPQSTTRELVTDALAKAQRLLRFEIALARDEVGEEIDRSKRAAAFFLGALITVSIGIALVVVSLALAGYLGPAAVGILGGAFLVATAGFGLAGYRSAPTKPLARTVERLQRDAKLVEEHVK